MRWSRILSNRLKESRLKDGKNAETLSLPTAWQSMGALRLSLMSISWQRDDHPACCALTAAVVGKGPTQYWIANKGCREDRRASGTVLRWKEGEIFRLSTFEITTRHCARYINRAVGTKA